MAWIEDEGNACRLEVARVLQHGVAAVRSDDAEGPTPWAVGNVILMRLAAWLPGGKAVIWLSARSVVMKGLRAERSRGIGPHMRDGDVELLQAVHVGRVVIVTYRCHDQRARRRSA